MRQDWILVVLSLLTVVRGNGVDEDITDAADSSDAFSVLQPNKTVRIELDLKIPLDEYVYMQKYGKPGQETRPVEKRDMELVQRYKRKGLGDTSRRWKDKTVPFDFKDCYPGYDLDTIYASMADYHRYTCIRWRLAKAGDKEKAQFQDDNGGCYAYPGVYGKTQPINLSRGCRRKGTVIHEMAHTVGLLHEQSRPDRDDYITIHTENMMYGMDGQFNKASRKTVPDWGVKYDYESVMHYGQYAFSANKRRTITAKDSNYQTKMGNRIGFAFSDIKMISIMYNCNEHCKRKPKCPGSGFVGKDCKCWCKGPSLQNPIKYCDGSGEPTEPGPKVEKDTKIEKECGSTSGKGGGNRGGGGPCKDSSSDCRKHRKYCNAKSWFKFMTENCKRTCRFCRADPVSSGSSGLSQFRKGPKCIDGNDRCPQFAEQGECKTNVAYMASTCRRSCGLCSRSFSKARCEDTNPNCKDAVDAGLCNIDTVVMHAECKKSCGLCG